MDFTASDTAKLTHISVHSINTVYINCVKNCCRMRRNISFQ